MAKVVATALPQVEKPPPNNPEAERAVLGSALIDPDVVGVLANVLEPGNFWREAHRLIWQAICDAYRRGMTPDFVVVADELENAGVLAQVGGTAYLTELIDTVPTSIHAEYYARIVVQDDRLRQLLRAAGDIAALVYSDGDVDDALARARKLVAGIPPASNGHGAAVPLSGEALANYLALLVERAGTDENRLLRLPWRAFDDYVPPLSPGTLVGLIAEPGVGKTAFMENVAEDWARRGKHTVFFHAEFSLSAMLDRQMQRESGVPIGRLRVGSRGHDDDWPLISEALGRIEQQLAERITYVHCPGWTMGRIVAELTRIYEGRKVDAVVVDYLNKVKVVENGSTMNYAQARGQQVEEFKTACEQIGAVGIMAAQFDKAAKLSKGWRGLSGARDTGELEDKAQVGLALDRPRDADSGERAAVTTVSIDKVSEGRTGVVQLYFDGPRLRFADLQPGEAPEQQRRDVWG